MPIHGWSRLDSSVVSNGSLGARASLGVPVEWGVNEGKGLFSAFLLHYDV